VRVGLSDPEPLLEARGVVVRYGDVVAVNGVDLTLHGGEVAALMGRNGAGKSSLLWALQGVGPRQDGLVRLRGGEPPVGGVGLVPQTPADLLYRNTVATELTQADSDAARSGAGGPHARQLLDAIAPGIADDAHPRDLSEGQRLCLVLAVALRMQPQAVLLDEPTRGLDYAAKRALGSVLERLARGGRAVVVSTHDVEFVAAVADRVIVLADGEIVADGPTVEVVVASPAYAPQTAKILAPQPFLTVDQVAATLAGQP
jgi:energy-coupling factor transport system ATP-binding protein